MSLITKTFDYAPISRKQVEGKRKYLTPDGNAVASVTTILDATSDKSGLIAWRKRVGETKAREITTEAAGVGTRMHKYLEDYIEFGEWPTPGSNPFAKKAHAMAEQVRDNAMVDVDEIWGSEVALYVPQLYAGTTDLVGKYKGNPCIMDFKQTNKPKKLEYITDYFLQLTAYALAHNEVYGTNIRKGVILMCVKPEVDDMGNVLTKPEYQEFVLSSADFDYWEQRWWKRLESYYLAS